MKLPILGVASKCPILTVLQLVTSNTCCSQQFLQEFGNVAVTFNKGVTSTVHDDSW